MVLLDKIRNPLDCSATYYNFINRDVMTFSAGTAENLQQMAQRLMSITEELAKEI